MTCRRTCWLGGLLILLASWTTAAPRCQGRDVWGRMGDAAKGEINKVPGGKAITDGLNQAERDARGAAERANEFNRQQQIRFDQQRQQAARDAESARQHAQQMQQQYNERIRRENENNAKLGEAIGDAWKRVIGGAENTTRQLPNVPQQLAPTGRVPDHAAPPAWIRPAEPPRVSPRDIVPKFDIHRLDSQAGNPASGAISGIRAGDSAPRVVPRGLNVGKSPSVTKNVLPPKPKALSRVVPSRTAINQGVNIVKRNQPRADVIADKLGSAAPIQAARGVARGVQDAPKGFKHLGGEISKVGKATARADVLGAASNGLRPSRLGRGITETGKRVGGAISDTSKSTVAGVDQWAQDAGGKTSRYLKDRNPWKPREIRPIVLSEISLEEALASQGYNPTQIRLLVAVNQGRLTPEFQQAFDSAMQTEFHNRLSMWWQQQGSRGTDLTMAISDSLSRDAYRPAVDAWLARYGLDSRGNIARKMAKQASVIFRFASMLREDDTGEVNDDATTGYSYDERPSDNSTLGSETEIGAKNPDPPRDGDQRNWDFGEDGSISPGEPGNEGSGDPSSKDRPRPPHNSGSDNSSISGGGGGGGGGGETQKQRRERAEKRGRELKQQLTDRFPDKINQSLGTQPDSQTKQRLFADGQKSIGEWENANPTPPSNDGNSSDGQTNGGGDHTDGNADGGNSGGGNSGGGNSDGGNSDGGNSDGGNSDGGNSDGGNSGGGNSGGGNSGGGNSGGGNSGGGNSGGGNSGGGNSGGGNSGGGNSGGGNSGGGNSGGSGNGSGSDGGSSNWDKKLPIEPLPPNSGGNSGGDGTPPRNSDRDKSDSDDSKKRESQDGLDDVADHVKEEFRDHLIKEALKKSVEKLSEGGPAKQALSKGLNVLFKGMEIWTSTATGFVTGVLLDAKDLGTDPADDLRNADREIAALEKQMKADPISAFKHERDLENAKRARDKAERTIRDQQWSQSFPNQHRSEVEQSSKRLQRLEEIKREMNDTIGNDPALNDAKKALLEKTASEITKSREEYSRSLDKEKSRDLEIVHSIERALNDPPGTGRLKDVTQKGSEDLAAWYWEVRQRQGWLLERPDQKMTASQ